MASLSAILQLVDLATGESSYGSYANWGEVADFNFSALEDALGEVTSKTLSSSNVTLSADEERSLLIKLSGTLSANVEVRTNDRKGFWFVTNDTTGDFTVTFKTTSGTGIVVPQGGRAILVSDGTNVLRMMNVGAGGSASRPVYASKSGSYTALQSDDGAIHEYSATATVSFKPAALLGAGWTYVVRANGGIVTLDPNASELVNGATTLAIADGTSAIIVCTGTAFRVIVILSGVASIPSASTTVSGISELSTDAEAIAKADTGRTLTPSNLAALGSSATFAGLVELATNAEAIARSDTARAVTPANLAAVTTVDDWSGVIVAPANQDYRIVLNCSFAGTINETTTRSASGTCTMTFKVNTTALGGTANSVSSTEQTQAQASANTFVAGDDIVITVSSNSSCVDASFKIKYTRVF